MGVGLRAKELVMGREWRKHPPGAVHCPRCMLSLTVGTGAVGLGRLGT